MFFSKSFDYLRGKVGYHTLPTMENGMSPTNQGSHQVPAPFPNMTGHPSSYGPYPTPQWNYTQNYAPPQAQQYPYPYSYPYSFPQAPPPAPIPLYHTPHKPFVPYSQPAVPYYSQAPVAPPAAPPAFVHHSRNRSQSRHARDAESHAPPASRSGLAAPTLNNSNIRLDKEHATHNEARNNPRFRREPTPGPSRPRRPATPHPEASSSLTVADEPPIRKVANKYYSLLNELSSTPEYPLIDWNITHRLHHAKMTVRPGKTEQLDMNKIAIYPDPPFVYITTLNLSSALQDVLNRWGPIIIRPRKSADKSESLPFTLGDILQALHRYFNTYLSREEVKALSSEENVAMRGSGSKRWRAAHESYKLGWSEKDDRDLLSDISEGYVRADFLDGHLYFGGLQILSNFHETKTLYLILENSPPKKT
ncbi:hypothetical protein CPB84DRAFT_1964042 [Gymnopilus junonius]|uniref:DUF6699 domain-containing protein n=1 Tax=Gymnopilus junonius TaxID=109634 RepID=A0A9P5NGG3_GYMJU|nr:hypothetical protein CPB84DRAFT_1964042 [Gymnopilus junonius]